MASYSAPRTAINSSLRELTEIFRWVYDREGYGNSPITVLIGGWAVYSYNQWYGSVDIDIVTNNKTRQDLMWHLRNDRGFVPQRDAMAPTTVVKDVPEGKILIDFGSREDIYRFEGRIDECPFSLLDGHTQMREIGAGFPVIVPEQTLLIIFKLKAAWDWSEPLLVDNELSNINSWREIYEKDEAALRSCIQDIGSSRT